MSNAMIRQIQSRTLRRTTTLVLQRANQSVGKVPDLVQMLIWVLVCGLVVWHESLSLAMLVLVGFGANSLLDYWMTHRWVSWLLNELIEIRESEQQVDRMANEAEIRKAEIDQIADEMDRQNFLSQM